MLGLQVAAPGNLVFERVVVLFEQRDGVRVGDADKVGICHVLKARLEALVDKLVEEIDVLRAALQNVADDVLDHGLHQVHVVVEVGKGDLRLHHPELAGMARRERALGAERRAESVHLAERHRHALRLQLAGNRQRGLLGEEILAVIDGAVFCARRVLHVQRRDLEHFARALAVAAGDDRRVHIDKAVLVEELVDRIGCRGTHAERRVEQVRARAQMRDRAQILDGVALFLQWVFRRGSALHNDFRRLQLKRLLRFGREDERAGHTQRSADVLRGDLLVILDIFSRENDLDAFEAAAVIKIDKSECFRVADRSRPAANRDRSVLKRFGRFVQGHNFCSFHCV